MDDSYSQANPIPVDGTVQHHNFHKQNDEDWVSFQVESGIVYTITTSNLVGVVDTQLWLYDSDGTTLLVFNDDYMPGSFASRIVYTATYDGILYAKVTEWQGRGECGFYDLSVTKLLPTSTPTPTATAGATPTPSATPTPTAIHPPTPTHTRTPTLSPTPTATPMVSPTPTATGWLRTYLPIVLRIYPPLPEAPVLYPIDNDDGDGYYIARWSTAERAEGYTLQEQKGAADWQQVYEGAATQYDAQGRTPGTYAYRVRAFNTWGTSRWSDTQSVVVSTPTPTPTTTPTRTPTRMPTPTQTPTPTPASVPGKLYAIADATVLEGYPGLDSGSTEDMWVGYDHCYRAKITRSLVKFDLSGIPAGTSISQATLYLHLIGSCDSGERRHEVTVYRAKANWSESSVNWNNKPGYAEAYGSASIPSRTWGWYSFDVSNLVRGWVNGSFPNYGLILRGPESSGNDSAMLQFYTRDKSGRTYDPYLSITYAGMATSEERAPAHGEIPNLTECEPAVKDVLSTFPGAWDFGAFEFVEKRVCSPD